MPFVYALRPIADSWPGPRTPRTKPSPFGANWGDTLRILEREIRALGGRSVVFAVMAGARDIRNDGGLRADARLRDPAVIVEFKVGPDLLAFPCDTFDFWQDNLRAVALALEALRKVDRYGVRKGRQYEGFKALPGAGASSATLDADRAARIIAEAADHGFAPDEIVRTPRVATDATRVALSRSHPDRSGGRTETFQLVQDARRALAAHHGVAL